MKCICKLQASPKFNNKKAFAVQRSILTTIDGFRANRRRTTAVDTASLLASFYIQTQHAGCHIQTFGKTRVMFKYFSRRAASSWAGPRGRYPGERCRSQAAAGHCTASAAPGAQRASEPGTAASLRRACTARGCQAAGLQDFVLFVSVILG